MDKCNSKTKVILLIASFGALFPGVLCKCDGICVPLAQCSTNFGGSNIFDLRVGTDVESACDHYLEVCCKDSDVIFNDTNSSERLVEQKEFQGCGLRNVDGVGFRLTHATHNETEFGEFPWMVALFDVRSQLNEEGVDRSYICGGSLIEPNVVVTVAHCVNKKSIVQLVARAGEWDSKTTNEVLPFQERRVEKVIIHENFNQKFLFNDIALLFLEEPFQPDDHVQLLCLPQQEKSFDDHDNCIATGWGKEQFGSPSYQTILKKIELPIVARDDCQTALRLTRLGRGFQLHESFLCAGGDEGIDTCTSDVGSPLVCPSAEDGNRYQLAGMMTWRVGCGRSGVPGVYVKSSLYYDWIFRTVELYGLEKEEAEMGIV